MSLRDLLRFHWMPGTDLFTRRRVGLESHWAHGSRKVLDAGCGNGWFAYRACRGDATVTAVAISAGLVARGAAFYNDYLGIPPTRLRFVELNLYDLPNLGETYDEIICYETLEHIRDDRRVCEHFFAALNPGGTLHLCCPNADHPRWAAEVLDDEEQGGHVRCGYTEASYRALLEPLGFEIGEIEGVGGATLVFLQESVQSPARRGLGEVGAALVALAAVPFVWLDSRRPRIPFSIYVKAVRPVVMPTDVASTPVAGAAHHA